MRLQRLLERVLWKPLDTTLSRWASRRWWAAILIVLFFTCAPLWILVATFGINFALFLSVSFLIFALGVSWTIYIVPLRLRQMHAVVQKQLEENLRKHEESQRRPL